MTGAGERCPYFRLFRLLLFLKPDIVFYKLQAADRQEKIEEIRNKLNFTSISAPNQ